ncbi:MAG: GGDEF domain-containing protein [Cellvibrionaceae bacterium]|nr:GGDEF domain-containing protein [Cellvibrionaceae bacterium]
MKRPAASSEDKSVDYSFSLVDDIHCPAGEDCPWPEQVAELEAQLLTDPLTGLANYRHFSRALEQEMERTRRSGASTALLMVDIDFFKSVNDTYGHEAGNLALKALANCMLASFRRLDVVCRYGGEEFAVILPATEPLVATQVAERLRQNIELMETDISETQDKPAVLKITASIGIGIYTRQSKLEPKQLVQQADEQLYAAKNAGRNQVSYGVHRLEHDADISLDERDALSDLFGNRD